MSLFSNTENLENVCHELFCDEMLIKQLTYKLIQLHKHITTVESYVYNVMS